MEIMQSASKRTNQFISNFIKILKYIDRLDIKIVFFWSLLTLVVAVLPTFSVYLNKILVDNLTTLGQSVNKKIFLFCVLIIVGICLLELAITWLEGIIDILFATVNYRTTHRIQCKFYFLISNLPMEFFDDYILYKEIILAQDGLSTNGIEMVGSIISILSGSITVISLIIILCTTSWKLPFLMVASSAPALIAVLLTKKFKYQKHEALVEERKKRDYFSSLFMQKKALKELRIFKAFPYILNSWDAKDKMLLEEDIKLKKYENKLELFSLMFVKFCTIFTMIWLVTMIESSEITIGLYVSLITAISLLFSSLNLIFSSVGELYENNKYLTALFKIMSNEKISKNINLESDVFKLEEIEKIEIKNVSFSYPSASKKALQNINIEINKGDRIAIIGHNGSGKTTMLNVLMGLYENYDGEILVNGKKLDKETTSNYQSKLACVFQDISRYEMTIRENIALGNIQEIHNDEKIHNELRKIQFEKIQNYDFDTMLSPLYENGVDLSGGEWQKIALARANFRKAQVVFCDEPTSALDPEAEVNFYKNIIDAVSDKTLLIVSHRLAVTGFCNKIVVMENGQVVEVGTHKQLIERKGKYYRMYKKQIESYNIDFENVFLA